MGEIIARNMFSRLKLLINCYCCIWLVVYIIGLYTVVILIVHLLLIITNKQIHVTCPASMSHLAGRLKRHVFLLVLRSCRGRFFSCFTTVLTAAFVSPSNLQFAVIPSLDTRTCVNQRVVKPQMYTKSNHLLVTWRAAIVFAHFCTRLFHRPMSNSSVTTTCPTAAIWMRYTELHFRWSIVSSAATCTSQKT